MSNRVFVIINDEREPVFWRKANGWVALASADVFAEEEINTVVLPTGGDWLELPLAPSDMSLAPVDCQGCGAESCIELGPFENDGKQAWAQATCVICGYTYNEVYAFSHIEQIEKGK